MSPKRQTGDLTISKGELEKMALQFKNTFLKEAEDNPELYDPVDVDKIRKDDFFCQRFILHQRYLLNDKAKVEDALEQCRTSLKWRKEFNANCIKESSLSIELFEKNAVYPYGKDKLGNYTLVIIGKHHKRDATYQEEVRRYLIYWIEKLDQEGSGNKINVILSCEGAGISNLDLEIIRFLFNIFRQNYPYFLENIFVYNMPWIFIPAWKIIKTWLPEDAVDKIKFVNKKTILEYIDDDSLPVSLGGKRSEADNEQLENYKKACKQQLENIRKGIENNEKNEVDRDMDDSNIPKRVYLDVKPGQLIKFTNPDSKDRKPVFVVITNTYNQQVGFRIRSNSTESFKVRPFSGVLQSGASIDISIRLLEGHSLNGQEKFLIQAIPVGHDKLSSGSFNALWKNSHLYKRMEYKINCQYEEDLIKPVVAQNLLSEQVPRSEVIPFPQNNDQMKCLETAIKELRYWNSLLKIAVFFLLLIHFAFLANFLFHDNIIHIYNNVAQKVSPASKNHQSEKPF